MSTSALTGLRDYLYDTLSPANMLWLSTQLAEYAKKKEEMPLKRYTKAELNALLDEAEANIAAGNTISGEEVLREPASLFSEKILCIFLGRTNYYLYLCTQKRARTGCASAIGASSIALGLHRPCRRTLKTINLDRHHY